MLGHDAALVQYVIYIAWVHVAAHVTYSIVKLIVRPLGDYV